MATHALRWFQDGWHGTRSCQARAFGWAEDLNMYMCVGNQQTIQIVCSYHAIVLLPASYMNHTIDGLVMFLFCAGAVRKEKATFSALEAISQGMLMNHPSCLHRPLLESDEHVICCHGTIESSVRRGSTLFIFWINVHHLLKSFQRICMVF